MAKDKVVKINFNALLNNASSINNARNNLSDKITDASNTVSRLNDDVWMGNTKDEMMDEFSAHLVSDIAFVESLSSLSSFLKDTVATMKKADNKIESGVSLDFDSYFETGSLPSVSIPSLAFYPDSVKEATMKKLSGVNTELQARAIKFIEKAQEAGYNLVVVSGYRTVEQQRQLYNAYLRGEIPIAARPGKSKHNVGLAIDVSVCDDNWKQIHSANVGDKKWKELSEIASSVGIKWPLGTRDRPHFELDENFQG
jgi:D-alanyl-D-alanine carboxypeptidase